MRATPTWSCLTRVSGTKCELTSLIPGIIVQGGTPACVEPGPPHIHVKEAQYASQRRYGHTRHLRTRARAHSESPSTHLTAGLACEEHAHPTESTARVQSAMPLTMPSKRQKAVCCRPGCGKNPSRSIPTSLFTGARTKVCKGERTLRACHVVTHVSWVHYRSAATPRRRNRAPTLAVLCNGLCGCSSASACARVDVEVSCSHVVIPRHTQLCVLRLHFVFAPLPRHQHATRGCDATSKWSPMASMSGALKPASWTAALPCSKISPRPACFPVSSSPPLVPVHP